MPEKKDYKILKIVLIIAAVVLAILFAVFAVGAQDELKARDEELSKKAEQYVKEFDSSKIIDAIEGSNKGKDKEDSEGEVNLASVVLLFTDPNKAIIDAVAPVMDVYEQIGVLALPLKYQASDEVLSLDEIKGLQKKGWDVILNVKNDSENEDIVEAYKFYVKNKIQIAEDLYNQDERSIGGFIEVYGNVQKGAKASLEQAIVNSTPYCLAIGTQNLNDHYDSVNIDAMLKLLQQYEINESIKITNISGARERYDIAVGLGIIDDK